MPEIPYGREIYRLLDIMSRLRSDQGCPWDRKQTPESLKTYLLEETYEVLDAIDGNNPPDICDELGDLLLQIVFICQIYQEHASFDFNDAAGAIADKMVRRHPHVFADACPQHHAARWDEIKHQEREERGKQHNLANRLPKTLPALKTSTKIIKKHDPSTIDQVCAKINEISSMLHPTAHPVTGETPFHPATLMGDLLYTVVQLAVILNLDPEDILRQTNNRKIEQLDKKI